MSALPGIPPLGADTADDVKSLTFGRDEVVFKEGVELRGVEAGMHGVQSADLRAVALEDSEVLRLVDGRLTAVFLLIDTITDNY